MFYLNKLKKILSYFKKNHRLKSQILNLKKSNYPLKVVIGCGDKKQDGWIHTDKDFLDILDVKSWNKLFTSSSIDNILAEHVWEHFTLPEAKIAIANCFHFLKINGRLRLAVPDGFHPDTEYIKNVEPNGIGLGADDHKILYNYILMKDLFKNTAFQIEFVEYFDENENFISNPWDIKDGMIHRSMEFDYRNKNGKLNYTSLIIDAIKISND